MAAGQKLYPRATVKKIVKAHSKRNVSKNVDVLIFLDYALFLQTLMKEATINAKQARERGISAKSVKKVTEIPSSADIPLEVQGLRERIRDVDTHARPTHVVDEDRSSGRVSVKGPF